jgi:hypothetical protein
MRLKEFDVDIEAVNEGPGDMLLDFLFELDVDLREVRGRLRIGVEGTEAEERDWECLCRKNPRRRGNVSAGRSRRSLVGGSGWAPQCEHDLVRDSEGDIGEAESRVISACSLLSRSRRTRSSRGIPCWRSTSHSAAKYPTLLLVSEVEDLGRGRLISAVSWSYASSYCEAGDDAEVVGYESTDGDLWMEWYDENEASDIAFSCMR